MLWLHTDTHMNHTRMVELCHRPENFNELIIENWNSRVQPRDTVFHLGDFALGDRTQIASLRAQLNGNIFMLLGNHDHKIKSFKHGTIRWYEEQGFDFVASSVVRKNILFSHKPIYPLPEGITHCVFGHWHGGEHHLMEDAGPGSYVDAHREQYVHFHIEGTLAPVPLYEFLESRGIPT